MHKEYRAELDLDGAGISSGGIALHDGQLPLRRLGTGSSRLIVSALQHDAGLSHVSLIDEVEHGLEPHRIARLLTYLDTPLATGSPQSQVFLTTHSPVVVRELKAKDIFIVNSTNGSTAIRNTITNSTEPDSAQKHLRTTPEAFLARRIIVGEGKTEQGLVRGLDTWWTARDKNSFALRGIVPVDGGGKDKAPQISEYLLDLGYMVLLLHDTDAMPNAESLETIRSKGGTIAAWPDQCSTEERLFLDVPWSTVTSLIEFAVECEGPDSVLAAINRECVAAGLAEVPALAHESLQDCQPTRRALGKAAKGKRAWFKSIERGEQLAEIIGPCIDSISATPLAQIINQLRVWVDA